MFLYLFIIIKAKTGTFLSFHIRKLSFSLFWHSLFLFHSYPHYFFLSHFTFVWWGALIIFGFSLLFISILLFLIKLTATQAFLWGDGRCARIRRYRDKGRSVFKVPFLAEEVSCTHINHGKDWCVMCAGDTQGGTDVCWISEGILGAECYCTSRALRGNG